MRKVNFLLAMAFLVFIFSGCGGSADSNSETGGDDASALHTEITNILTGTWVFDETDFAGKATSTTDASILLYSVKEFRMSFSGIEFNSTATNSAANITVFYSFTSSARYESGSALGNVSVKSYSDTSSTIRTQEMVLTRVTDEQWVLSSSSSRVPDIIITRSSSRKIDVVLSGTGYLEGINGNCSYSINGSLVKTSDTPSTEDNSGSSTGETNIKDILEGTWKLITEDEATAISTTEGILKVLALRLATSVDIKLSSIDLKPDDNTTSQTGTVKVFYHQKWQAFNTNNNNIQATGDFIISKDETMKIAQVSAYVWRIEDITNDNENITVTINENDNSIISVTYKGTATTLEDEDYGSYYYDITASFRKQ